MLYFSIIILLYIVSAFLLNYYSVTETHNSTKYGIFQLMIYLCVTLFLNLYIIKVSKNKNFIALAAPIIFTMAFMAVFEYIFVKIIDQRSRNSLGWTIHRTNMKKMLVSSGEDEHNFYKSMKKCKMNEDVLRDNIKNLNGNFFGIILSILCVLCINFLYKLQNNKNKLSVLYSTGISIASILYLFLFYYVNISSKMTLEPKITGFIPKTTSYLNKYKKQENTKVKNEKRSIRFQNSKMYTRSLEYCAEICNDSKDCKGFVAKGNNCNNLVLEYDGMKAARGVDFYMKN